MYIPAWLIWVATLIVVIGTLYETDRHERETRDLKDRIEQLELELKERKQDSDGRIFSE
jgi:hypothetical protein